jgi:hypothetical protein
MPLLPVLSQPRSAMQFWPNQVWRNLLAQARASGNRGPLRAEWLPLQSDVAVHAKESRGNSRPAEGSTGLRRCAVLDS